MGGVMKRVNRANRPALWPELYQTDLPAAPRYTIMKPTNIPRIYHHVTGLTTEGTIVVAGCDACYQVCTTNGHLCALYLVH
jgi:hypothetical protein